MSIDHVSRVLGLPPDVSGTERMVLFVLAEAANQDTDECWPSTATIARRAGLRQDRYVVKAVASLAAMGLVEVDPNGCPDQRIRADRRPNLYRMVGPMAVTDGGARRAGSFDATGGRDAHHGGARRAPTGGRDAHSEPHIEPEVEPSLEPSLEPEGAFAALWDAYPARNGRKIGKADAERAWSRLSPQQRREAMACVANYAADCREGRTLAKDAHRWLRPGVFGQWLQPAAPDQRASPRQQRKADAMSLFVGDEQPSGAVAAAFFRNGQQPAIGGPQ